MKIFDSEVHPWCRIPHKLHYPSPGEDMARVVAEFSAETRRHFWPASRKPGEPPLPGPVDYVHEALAMMDEMGIAAALLMPSIFRCSNDRVAAAAAVAPDRLKGLARFGEYLPPFIGAAHKHAALDDLEHGLRDLKLAGIGEVGLIEWWPQPQKVAVADFRDIFALADRYSVPICIHTAHNDVRSFAGGGDLSTPMWDFGNPLNFDQLATDYPRVRLIMFHMGKKDRRIFDLSMDFARKHPQVLLSTSLTSPDVVTKAVNQVGDDRLVFGSDWFPFDSASEPAHVDLHRKQLSFVEQARIPDRAKEKIFWDNLAAVFSMN